VYLPILLHNQLQKVGIILKYSLNFEFQRLLVRVAVAAVFLGVRGSPCVGRGLLTSSCSLDRRLVEGLHKVAYLIHVFASVMVEGIFDVCRLVMGLDLVFIDGTELFGRRAMNAEAFF
jgi:hypothetical protein